MKSTIRKYTPVLLLFGSVMTGFAACNIIDNWALSEIPNEHEFQQTLSVYGLFEGKMTDLIPSSEVQEFSLTTELFTDYASKQRLIKLPAGESIQVNSDGTFDYPEKTLIAKTFFYPSIKSEGISDRQILETRILLKVNSTWNVAVYEWNRDQTEAYLITNGSEQDISWLDNDKKLRSTRYGIPSLAECTTCHQASKKVVPLGPKIANMNHDVRVNDEYINQLDYLENAGILSSLSRDQIQFFPDWSNMVYPAESRARAYLDVNCAHCHNPTGIADHTSLFFSFDTSLPNTGIVNKKNQIQRRIQSKRRDVKMPKIGTTVIHDEGVELIKEYLDKL